MENSNIEAVKPTAVLLTAAQCAAVLGVDRSTFFRWNRAGVVPAPNLRRGRIVRWHKDSIAAFALSGEAA